MAAFVTAAELSSWDGDEVALLKKNHYYLVLSRNIRQLLFLGNSSQMTKPDFLIQQLT